MDVDPDEALAERVSVRFRAAVSQRVPLRTAFVDALVRESRPAVHALLFAVQAEQATEPYSLAYHETTAMFSLLGRAFAMDGATPTAAMLVVPLMLEAFRSEGVDVPLVLDGPLSVIFVEGYVRGREERVVSEAERVAVTRVGLSELAPGCYTLVLRGAFTHESLNEILDECARGLLRADAAACTVDIRSLVEPNADHVRQLRAFAETCEGLGTHVRFVGDAGAYAALTSPDASLTFASSALAATTDALADAGFSLRRVSRIETSIRELVRARGHKASLR